MKTKLRLVATALVFGVLLSGCVQEDATPTEAPSSIEADSPTENPVEIDGTFTGRVTKQDLSEYDYVPKNWPGEWTLTMSAAEYVLEYTNFRVTEEIEASEDEIVITATPAPDGAFNCYDEDDVRLTGEGEAGASYGYVLTDETLELTAEEEPCGLRRALLERTWELTP